MFNFFISEKNFTEILSNINDKLLIILFSIKIHKLIEEKLNSTGAISNNK